MSCGQIVSTFSNAALGQLCRIEVNGGELFYARPADLVSPLAYATCVGTLVRFVKRTPSAEEAACGTGFAVMAGTVTAA